MTCPVCHRKSLAGSDFNPEGFAADLMECDHCGATWVYKDQQNRPVLVNFGSHQPTPIVLTAYAEPRARRLCA